MSDPETGDEWDAESYDDQCAFVYEYGNDVVDMLAPKAGERVLDLGCGTGQLSRRMADHGVDVVGVDASAEMVAQARAAVGTADEREGSLQFVHCDARELTLDDVGGEPFDGVFSNAALHWIPDADHDAVLTNVADVLGPDGCFVAELGGHGNVASVVDAVCAELDTRGYDAENPWYFPSIGEYAPRLEAYGFEVREAHLFDRPTELDGGAEGLARWLDMFGGGLLEPVTGTDREAVVEAVEDRLREEWFRDEIWVVDYRRLRFHAVREA